MESIYTLLSSDEHLGMPTRKVSFTTDDDCPDKMKLLHTRQTIHALEQNDDMLIEYTVLSGCIECCSTGKGQQKMAAAL
jgi:hypothetical protein